MGKDDKQRRKTQNASSSRAAELLQSSGSSVPFLPLNSADTGFAFSSDPNGLNSDDYGDIDADLRISFRKLTKREANTRERGLKAIADVINNSPTENTGVSNGAKYFSSLYNLLIFDSSSNVRAAANNVLRSFIIQFRTAVSTDVMQMLPYTLISLSDSSSVVNKASLSVLNDCFDEQKKQKLFEKTSSKSIKICLDILQRKHTAVAKQKFEDLESHTQRCERIVLQCLNSLNNLQPHCESVADVVATLDDVYSPLAKMGLNVEAQIIKCVLSLLQAGHVQLIVDTRMSMNILKLLESEHEALSKNSFACYMYMADAIAKGKAKTAFKTADFVNSLVLRMVANKGQHFKSLEECLLPLIIIAIKSSDEKTSAKWILEVLEAFHEGKIESNVLASWCRTFKDVVEFIYDHYKYEDSSFWEEFQRSVLKFCKFYVENIPIILPEERTNVQNTCSTLIGRLSEGASKFKGIFEENIISLFVSLLPQSSDLIRELASASSSFQPKNALIARSLESENADEQLFKDLLSSEYQSNEELDHLLLEKRLFVWFTRANSVYLDCFRFLRSKGFCKSINLLEKISFNSLIDLQILFDVSENGHLNLVSADEAIVVLDNYLSLVQNEPLCGNPWTNGFLNWLRSLTDSGRSKFIHDAANSPMTPLRLAVKLVLKFNDSICQNYLTPILQKMVERLLTFDEFIDIEDRSPLDEILRKLPLDRSLIENSRSCLVDPTNTNFERLFEFGRAIRGISSVVEQFEVGRIEITNLCNELDKMTGELIFLDGMPLTTYALSAQNVDFSSWDRMLSEKSLSLCQQSMFYMGMDGKSEITLLFIGISASVLRLWRNHSIMRTVNESSEELFFTCWNNLHSSWEASKWQNIFALTLRELFSSSDVSLIVLQFFRSFGFKNVAELSDIAKVSAISESSQNRVLASFGFDFEFSGLKNSDLFAFLRSLERSSHRLSDQGRTAEDENLALVLLADLKTKVQSDEEEWLFLVNGQDAIRDAISCAVLRLMVHLAKITTEMPKELRDFVLCGLVSAVQNSMKETEHNGLSRLMTVFALRFFTEYDRSLRTALLLIKSVVNPTDDILERRSRLQENLAEWTDFFGNAVATCVMTWFCWFCIHDDYDPAISYPEFLRIEVGKTVLIIDGELGIFDVINSPTPLLTSRVIMTKQDSATLTTKELLNFIAMTLRVPHPEIQLAAVSILQSNLLSIVKDEVNEYEEMMKELQLNAEEPSTSSATVTVEEPTELEPQQWEHKLFHYFTDLIQKIGNDGKSQNSLDPELLIVDLMIRVVRLLDAQSAGAFCSKLEGDIVDDMFRRLFCYIPLDASSADIADYVQTPPSAYFIEKSKRLLSNASYSCWLYFRALETIPAVVREWFAKVTGNQLKEFTKRNMSALLIGNEMKRIGSVRSENFVMRARPTTREIVARCQLEDLSLELVIVLPEDYPLSSTVVQHDQRNVLAHGLTKTLHKNLFAFVNNRNGAIIDGILQWKRNVEKTMEGVESCSICLMTVSTSNYRLPDLRCRTCKKKFHSSCMYKWIQSSAKPSCPLCRADFC